MSEKILFVDDDADALAAYRRNLRKQFEIETATSGEEGLETIDRRGPFAAIVSDLRMPGMDGTQFLAEAKARAPHSTLMMFTGYADLETAFENINEGTVFRFLIKPCRLDSLVNALKAGIAHHKLLTSEREVLQETVRGSIELLTEILGMINPTVFGRATRTKAFVRDIAVQMQLPNLWQLEVATMLSQIGTITVPSDVLEKAYAGESLTKKQQETLSSHPAVGSAMVANIPRLGPIAQMIEAQKQPFNSFASEASSAQEREVTLGAQILKVALDLDQLVARGLSPRAALSELGKQPAEYNPEVVTALTQAKGTTRSFFEE